MRFVAVIVSVPNDVARIFLLRRMSKAAVADEEKFHGLAILVEDRRINGIWNERWVVIRDEIARRGVESQTIFKLRLPIDYGVCPLKFLGVCPRQIRVERVNFASQLFKLFVCQVNASSEIFLRLGLNLFIALSMPSRKMHSTAGISSSKALAICAESSGVKGLSTW